MKTPSEYKISTQVLALIRFGGLLPRAFDALLQHYGSPEAILLAEASSLSKVAGVSAAAAAKIAETSDHLEAAEQYATLLGQRGIELATRFDDAYGHLLFELNDPPPMLYVRGHLPSPDSKSVTLVGAENASAEGITLTTRVSRHFAESGVQIISSLNGGIDGSAHLGARKADGRSYAILDMGFDHIDSREQMPLAIEIAGAGGVITEYPPDCPPKPASMGESNRLLVGMSQAVVITELYHDSKRVHDLLTFCGLIGKLTFLIVDDEFGPLCDTESLNKAVANGAIVLRGKQQVADIIKSLV